ncbi:ExbD/TolR family protein [Puniceicoccus vermicola]|uniref:Biopolymer transporter ExbD n=1 Tax=Puniceicoccus vermicola TaxID=388746 RepID=A0A7X1E571_9BACT|nr:biopolymer transporter ExbD [Puniceicoccus vermicola]MBC2602824.1 biopolymer transporter ExbD [Puniceicoccus vermicola]
MNTWTPSGDDEGFELTPMIDVVFLLIAFFMTITSEITEENIKIEVPIAVEAQVPEERGVRQTISIDASGNIFFGARQLAPDELADAIRVSLENSPDTRVYLRADARTPHRYVQDVMQATANAGLYDLIFATNQE